MLLFSICEGLMNLIFPFKWLHTYIPVLPREQIDYLDSPTPYLMGVLSSYVDYEYLRESYPNHIICDVNTSMIYGTPPCTLPSLEEINLRKKIQYIKKPELYEMEDLRDEFNQSGDIFNIEDIGPFKTISENIQNVFFRIFFKTLKNIEKLYIKNHIFDSKSFLDDIFDEETKNFWEKIINTVAFEFFILSFQYLDDSNTKIFKNILKLEDDEKNYFLKNQSYIYTYSMNLQNNINFLIKELENKANIYNNKYLSGGTSILKSPPFSEVKKHLNEDVETVNFQTEENFNLYDKINHNNINFEFFSFEKYKENLYNLKKDYNLVIEKINLNNKKNIFEDYQKCSIVNTNGDISKNSSFRKSSNILNSRMNYKNINNNPNIKNILNFSRRGSNGSNIPLPSHNFLKNRKRNNFSYDFSRNPTGESEYSVIEESNMELRPSHLQQSDKNTTNQGSNGNASNTVLNNIANIKGIYFKYLNKIYRKSIRKEKKHQNRRFANH